MPPLDKILSLLFLALTMFTGLFMLNQYLRNYLKVIAARSWPTTWGVVEKCELVESPHSDSTTYHVEVKYSYKVKGKEYQSERIGFGYSGTNSKTKHQEIDDQIKSGTRIIVRYDPNDPSQSILFAQKMPGGLAAILLGAMFTLIPLVFVLDIIRDWNK